MLTPEDDMQVFVALHPVDMRKSTNGLILEILKLNHSEPQSGNLFIFRNRKSDLIKAVFWHHDGFVLIQKRLENHKFKFPRKQYSECFTIDKTQLQWLLSGFDFTRVGAKDSPKFTDYC